MIWFELATTSVAVIGAFSMAVKARRCIGRNHVSQDAAALWRLAGKGYLRCAEPSQAREHNQHLN